jgi:hypothetical protein
MDRKRRTALILWLVFSFVVWNVIFDRVLVLAGRRYAHAAATAVQTGGPYVKAAGWMIDAQERGVRLATAASGAILFVGVGALALSRRSRARRDR